MFLGLRMMDGVSGSEFLKRFGVNMWNVYGDVLGKLVENHLIQADNPYIRLTDFGVDISNYVLSEFLL
jgi:oxygen-independent coproporphyrinogen-3 oxidase